MGSLIARGAKVRLVAGGLQFAEGPLWLPDGRLIVSEISGDDVLSLDPTGKRRVFRQPSNVANGHALASDGSLVEAEAGSPGSRGQIARIAADGSVSRVLADSFQGKRLNAPNDLIVKHDGTIWFTDPHYNQTTTSQIGFNGVYRVDPRTRSVTLMTRTLADPNGIAFSPNQKTLYVSDTDYVKVYAYSVTARNTLGARRELGRGCDGIGVDERGNVWATTCNNRIVVTSPKGIEVGAIPIPGTTTNLAWGGRDRKTLFVTTTEGGVYSLALTVREAR